MINEEIGEKRKINTRVFDDFKGADYSRSPLNIHKSRAADCLNMVRSEVGKVQKRTGFYYEDFSYRDKIYGVHILKTENGTIRLVHRGDKLYANSKPVYAGANKKPSSRVQMGNRLYIVDGKGFLCFDSEKVTKVTDNGFVPTVYTGRKATGGGKRRAQRNILSPWQRETFFGDGQSEYFALSCKNIEKGVTATVTKADGTSYTLDEENGLQINYVAGVVTFLSPPPEPRARDEDNIVITYRKATEFSPEDLNKCTVIGLFGKGGRSDTLFLTGNPEKPGVQWYSVPGKRNYFGEDNIRQIGTGENMGYSRSGDKLFVHKRFTEKGANIYVCRGEGNDDNFMTYPVVSTLYGPGTISKFAFGNLNNDPLFLTDSGVYGITESESGEQCFLNMRSGFINPQLLQTENLNLATAAIYDNFYILAKGEDIYLLDSLQKSARAGSTGKYGYECYRWKVPADIDILFVRDGKLCFAEASGKIGCFYTDYSRYTSFNDNGLPIQAYWQTGEFIGGGIYKRKSIYKLWRITAPAIYTGVRVYRQKKGLWESLFADSATARVFVWSKLVWSKFTWSTDGTPRKIMKNIRLKNIYKTAFRFENNELNEPFGIYEAGIAYTES